MYKILVCDDEKDIVSALKIYLESENYQVVEAFNGAEALEKMNDKDIKLVLMDIMMPVMNGIEALSKIRGISNVPVILLTAKGEDTDKVLGLNVGADDYVTKPFNPVELQARVKSQLRRFTMLGSDIKSDDKNELSIGGITLDDDSKQVYLDGDLLNLTRTEYDILKLLLENKGKVLSPKDIYTNVWKDDIYMPSENTIAVHIRHIREKIEYNPANPHYLKAVWGRGYKMEDDGK